jgi:hypothetical protein
MTAASAGEESSTPSTTGAAIGSPAGPELEEFLDAVARDDTGRLGHLAPGAVQIAQRLGHDEPCVGGE